MLLRIIMCSYLSFMLLFWRYYNRGRGQNLLIMMKDFGFCRCTQVSWMNMWPDDIISLTPMNEMIPVDLPGGGLRTQHHRRRYDDLIYILDINNQLNYWDVNGITHRSETCKDLLIKSAFSQQAEGFGGLDGVSFGLSLRCRRRGVRCRCCHDDGLLCVLFYFPRSRFGGRSWNQRFNLKR